MSKMSDFRYFTLYGSFAGERDYRSNRRIGVVAKSIKKAVEIAEHLWPGTTIFDISHHGAVDAIDSDAESLIIANSGDDELTAALKGTFGKDLQIDAESMIERAKEAIRISMTTPCKG